MKILVISDSHSIQMPLYQLLYDWRDKVDLMIHCGDSELLASDTIWQVCDGVVKGNMDFDYNYQSSLVLSKNNVTFYVTHGHLCSVNSNRKQLARLSKEANAKIAFYGHTHILNCEMIDGVICINPGSFNHSRGPINERTFAIITIENDKVTVEYFNQNYQNLSQLTKHFYLEG